MTSLTKEKLGLENEVTKLKTKNEGLVEEVGLTSDVKERKHAGEKEDLEDREERLKTKIADFKEEVKILREEVAQRKKNGGRLDDEMSEVDDSDADGADGEGRNSDKTGKNNGGGSSKAIYLVGFLLVLVNLGCYAAFDVHTFVQKQQGLKKVVASESEKTVSEVHHFHTNQKEFVTEIKEKECPSTEDILKACPICPPKVDSAEV